MDMLNGSLIPVNCNIYKVQIHKFSVMSALLSYVKDRWDNALLCILSEYLLISYL